MDGADLAQLPAHRHLRDLGCRSQALGQAREAEERALRTEEEARRAVEDERNRITRELHDVLAHSVSVMTVQASAVRRLLKPEQQREREALMTVEETGRQALSEMRRLIGIMRTEEEVPALAPQPGLGTLPALVEQVRQSGLPVELTVEGEPVKLPAGVDLSAYRIVQEALTNALKHAGPAHAWVAVRYVGDDVEIEVANDGRSQGEQRRRRPRPGRHARARGALRRRAAVRPTRRRRLPDLGAAARDRISRMTVRVLIVDDQALVRAGFKMILESEPEIEIVGEAEDGVQAVDAARELKPDVVLMDIRMPNLDGLEATRRILAATDDAVRVLMLTTFDLDEYVYEALRAGASGFMLKDTPPEQLISAIHVVASGDALLSPAITKRVIEEFIRRPPSTIATQPSPAVADLTARELEVLGFMARGLSNAEIAKDLFVSETTVKTHVARILMKLGLRDRVQAVVFAYETGLVEPGAIHLACDASSGLVPAPHDGEQRGEACQLEEAVHLGRRLVRQQEHERALALLVLGEALEQDPDHRRVDERGLRQVDDERRRRPERAGEVRADPGRGVRVRFAANLDDREASVFPRPRF